MTRNIKKKAVLVGVAVILVLSMAAMGYASGTSRMLQAWYMNIKIRSNGQEIVADKAPFIVDGTTYVPVRMMAEIFDKNVEWDGVNYIISITDKPGSSVNSLKTQLVLKDFEIEQLRKEIEELEEELESSELDIDDLEDQLNDDYDEYEDIEFEITLSGDEDEITVRIDFDLDDFEDEWDDLSTSDIKDYLQDICDDILDVFDDADIEGYFKDSSGSVKSKMFQFTTSSKGTVVFENGDDDVDADLSDLEDDLNDDYWDYFDDIELYIELEGDEEDIIFYVYVDYDEYQDEWDDLSDGEIEDLMADIYYDIEDVFDDADIVGYAGDMNTDQRLARYDPERSQEFTRY